MYGITIVLTFFLYIKNGLGFEPNMIIIMIASLFKIVANIVLFATIAFILEKNSTAIIANLFLPNIMILILSVADSNLHVNMSKYWIDNVGTKIVENPALSNLGFPIIMYIIYIVICVFIGLYVSKGKEIK